MAYQVYRYWGDWEYSTTTQIIGLPQKCYGNFHPIFGHFPQIVSPTIWPHSGNPACNGASTLKQKSLLPQMVTSPVLRFLSSPQTFYSPSNQKQKTWRCEANAGHKIWG